MDNISLNLCQTCIDSGYEPRWVIILAARSNGTDSVKNYIINKRYVGQTITGIEIIQ